MNHPPRPFRWDLVRPDQLGTLLSGTDEPNLWFLEELVACSAKVLASSADGELYFVGRSADTIYDLLSGALADTSWCGRLHQLPLSLRGYLFSSSLNHGEIEQLRAILSAAELAPERLGRGRRPVVFVDVVASGGTFENLHRELRQWCSENRAPWDVIRRKLHFVGITPRKHTSPKTWRWQQHAEWTAELPARAVRNVSLDWSVWDYFANNQVKLTASFHRGRWADEQMASPAHTPEVRQALAEAVAVVEAGRLPGTRDRLVRHIADAPAMRQPWLRTLINEMR